MNEAPPGKTRAASVSPVDIYETGLATGRLWAELTSGARLPVAVTDWSARILPGDSSLLDRCTGPTLDIGCGPGRLTAELATRGVEALGIDVSAAAIATACAAGGSALRRSVFGPLPKVGSWAAALLIDGNIGIGGDPEALLRRTRELLAPRGEVLIELAAPGIPSSAMTIRLQDESGRASDWFGWAQVGVDGIGALAAAAGLELVERWLCAGRWFVRLAKM